MTLIVVLKRMNLWTRSLAYQELPRQLVADQMCFGHHRFVVGWILQFLQGRDELSSWKTDRKDLISCRGEVFWNSCWYENNNINESETEISTNTYIISFQVSKLLSRITNSCNAWFTKPYIFTREVNASRKIKAD